MKDLWPAILVIGIAGCSPSHPPAPKPDAQQALAVHPHDHHRYSVTFALVKVRDSVLAQHGAMHGTNGYHFASEQAATNFAAYVLANTNEFSFTTISGNVVPTVDTGNQTSVLIFPDPKREAEDFETYGVRSRSIEASVAVKEEDDRGNVMCSSYWQYGYAERPPTLAISYGVGQPGAGGIVPVGTPYIDCIAGSKDCTVFGLFKLDRR